jgi:hypothetical protein
MAGRTRRRSSMALMPVVAVCAMLVAAGLALAASGLDAQILMRLRHPDDPAQALGPFWLQRSIRDVTALGSNTVLTVVLLLAALMLGLLGKARWGMGVMVSAAGALAAVTCLKVAFGRDRPDVLPELAVLSPSFPSSHAMMSATIYPMLGLIVAEAAERPAVRHAAVAAALAVGRHGVEPDLPRAPLAQRRSRRLGARPRVGNPFHARVLGAGGARMARADADAASLVELIRLRIAIRGGIVQRPDRGMPAIVATETEARPGDDANRRFGTLACGSASKTGSDPLSVHVGWDHAAPRSRARRRSSLARPYIWRLTS